ncbi:hypothetical protein VB796_19630 [Arcicella sp. LKC2W]|uniref:hypothetical protein n=1 Tax=Arcicella sp. LKC2W TaxID=2984198 RepID=UPI002B2089A2|nr:hypothetical protein [Arcicella sp. LKC2W]MEA5461284.1 hypothetical protein [Arcicella sp. LKC2W]
MLSVICFSKERPLQLHAYLESLIYYSGIKQEFINVLYVESEDIKYESVINQFSDIRWVKEKDFYLDLLNIVNKSENFILFGCDDVFFKDFFDVNDCIRQLTLNNNLFGFSLRLGHGINYLPKVNIIDNKYLLWDWQHINNEHIHWNYPWDVSGSIYKKSTVLIYLTGKKEIINPNRFESFLASSISKEKSSYASMLSSFKNSKCLTLTINRVQDEFPNDFDSSQQSDLIFLHQKYESGHKLDWYKFIKSNNNDIHVGAEYFSLIDKNSTPPESVLTIKNYADDKNSSYIEDNIIISLKIYVWRFIIFIKEIVRNLLPRKLLKSLRPFVKYIQLK